MSPQLLIFACVLQTVEQGSAVQDPRCDTPFVREVVRAVTKYGEHFNVPAHVMAALIWHESKYNKHARGAAGEIGLTQIKPNGAIVGKNLRRARWELEDVDTNVRIGMQYLSQFVRECDRAENWLTKYNRPARGCRPSRYSSGILSDLRTGRRVALFVVGGRSPYDTEASGSLNPFPSPTSPSMSEESDQARRTSSTEEDSRSSTPSDIHERRPSGIRRALETREQTPEQRLAAPFSEP